MITDIWRTHQYVGIVICCVAIPIAFQKKIGFSGAMLWAYMLLTAARVSFSPWAESPIQYRLDASSSQALVLAAIMPIVAIECERLVAWSLVLMIPIFFVDAVSVIAQGYGIFCAGTMDTAALAIFIPEMLSIVARPKFPAWARHGAGAFIILAVFAIFHRGGAIGVLALGAGVAGFLVARGAWGRAVIIPGVIAVAGALTQGKALLDDNARVGPWVHYFRWWDESRLQFSGTGLGTFEWIGPWISTGDGRSFIWMHNDWLQILFETGIVGFTLFMVFAVQMFSSAWKRPRDFGALCAIAVAMLGQFPLHFFLTQFYALIIVRSILVSESGCVPKDAPLVSSIDSAR